MHDFTLGVHDMFSSSSKGLPSLAGMVFQNNSFRQLPRALNAGLACCIGRALYWGSASSASKA